MVTVFYFSLSSLHRSLLPNSDCLNWRIYCRWSSTETLRERRVGRVRSSVRRRKWGERYCFAAGVLLSRLLLNWTHFILLLCTWSKSDRKKSLLAVFSETHLLKNQWYCTPLNGSFAYLSASIAIFFRLVSFLSHGQQRAIFYFPILS